MLTITTSRALAACSTLDEVTPGTVATQVQHLTRLRGIGPNGALTLSTELFAWRQFTNGRQIGACVGLTPTPYHSDQHMHEQGISRSGNRRVRALSVELAWKWLLWQPHSALSHWYHAHLGRIGARRLRRGSDAPLQFTHVA